MRRYLPTLAALLSLTVPAAARPLDGAQQDQLLAVFAHYNRAIAAGNLDQALALRTAAAQTALTQQFKVPNDRTTFLNEAREMVPDRVEVMHASVNDAGDKALLVLLASKTISGRLAQEEFDLSFMQEGGVWKLGATEEAPGPDDIKHCRDQSYQPPSAYQGGNPVTFSGRIERAESLPDHTLVLLMTGETEVCAFLPNSTVLQQHGLNPAIIQPWRIAEISGVAERSNPQKVMVNNITVHAEE
ncbi:MAG TPA: hypothetical protein VMB73_07890 [Acetobacteraceae bacterium]|nr:hypothetical protein [Acetobacteraceae bacterium]